MPKIYFHNTYRKVRVLNSTVIKKFIVEIFKEQNLPIDRLDFIFCSDSYLLTLNKKFLLHNYYTDILTFPLSGKHHPLIGEIYISLERIRDNAKKYDVSFHDEVRRVIFHGVLHLLGFKDRTVHQKKVMKEKEDEYLLKFSMFHA